MNKVNPTIINKSNHNFEDIKKSLENLIEELKKFSDDNNLSKIRFAKIIEVIDTKNKELLTVDELYRYSEARDLLDTLNYLKEENTQEEFLFKMKKTISGCNLLNEKNKTEARNYFFELKIATFFKKKNFKINFTKDSDIQIVFNDTKYNVQCKRPQNEKKIIERVLHANKQLSENTNGTKGIIALDLSKVFFNEITPEHNLVFETNNDINTIINLFDENYSLLVNNIKFDILDNVAFIICHLRFPCIILNPYQITIVNHFFTIKSKNATNEIKNLISSL
ncbi:hypothetical protein [Aliarcobacter butzleri]|uniref:hypothetical protein n=1 Tax=Aliarcobacter butzleri TaxID=28197 RepID=UPI00263CF46B|nr:hypothetical protein [Aliarcobacter butzleri]MDN5069048.1 hypothetical protein [Aliarcobacter butzleri]